MMIGSGEEEAHSNSANYVATSLFIEGSKHDHRQDEAIGVIWMKVFRMKSEASDLGNEKLNEEHVELAIVTHESFVSTIKWILSTPFICWLTS